MLLSRESRSLRRVGRDQLRVPLWTKSSSPALHGKRRFRHGDASIRRAVPTECVRCSQRRMRPALITGIASLLAVALLAPAAQAATQVREVHYEWPVPTAGVPGTPSEGAITLDFIFKNTRSNKKRFTPRLLTRIAFEQHLPDLHGPYDVHPPVLPHRDARDQDRAEKDPDSASKARPLRLPNSPPTAFPTSTARSRSCSGKPTGAPKPRSVLSWGDAGYSDLDADPSHPNCTNYGLGTWGGIPVVPV